MVFIIMVDFSKSYFIAEDHDTPSGAWRPHSAAAYAAAYAAEGGLVRASFFASGEKK